MSFIAYETASDYTPDPQYVNEPRNTMEYYAWKIGIRDKFALWVFQPAVASPTQDLINDILPTGEYEVIVIKDDLQSHGYYRTLMLDKTVLELEEFFTEEIATIQSLY